MLSTTPPGTPPRDPARVDATLVRTGAVLLAGALPVLLTVTTVSVAIDALARDFATPVSSIHWVVTAYLLAMTAAIPALGWLVDRWGARRVWIGALVAFAAGSALCVVAWSSTSLVLFRAVQGLGGGLVLPLLQTILARQAGPERMGRAMALVTVPGQVIPIAGPLVGGLLVDGPGWRWIFLVNLPLCLLAVALARWGIAAEPSSRSAERFDLMGMALLAPGLAALLYGLSRASSVGFAGDVLPWLAIGAVLAAAYGVRARRRAAPSVVDFRLFADRPFAVSAAVTFMLGVCVWGPMFLLPLYLQQTRGAGGLDAGLLLAPQGIGMMLGLLLAGRLADRSGPRRVVLTGLAVSTVATLPFAFAADHPSQWLLSVALMVRGVGLGAAGVPTLATAYRSLPSHLIPRATTVVSIAQRFGAALGTAVFAIVLARALSRVDLAPAAAYGRAFWWTVALTAVGLLPAWLLPSHPPGALGTGPEPPARSNRPDVCLDRKESAVMDLPVRTALIVASTREGRFGDTVAAWVADQARTRGDLAVDIIDLAEVDLPSVLLRDPGERVRGFAERVARAEAIVVVTPEYNHGYPASLKQAIDWLGEEWAAKPVAFVSYGGLSGGLRAVEQLRPVFAELHAVTIRDTLSFHDAHRQFEPDGSLRDPSSALVAAKRLFDQLVWWARALGEARRARPYAS